MSVTLLLPAFLLSLTAAPVKPVHVAPPPAAAYDAMTCMGSEAPTGFAFPLPGLDEYIPVERLDPSALRPECSQTPASAAQQFGERLQEALKKAWPTASAAVLATSEHVNLPSANPPLVKFCFVGGRLGETKSVSCGEVVYNVARGTIELRVDGRNAVTAATNAGPR